MPSMATCSLNKINDKIMTEAYWLDKIRCGENSMLQFKREKVNGNSLTAEFVAFANCKGGTVLFGVEDKTGELVGLDYAQMQELSEFVGNVATQICKPTIYIETDTFTLEGKKILAVNIAEGLDKPYKDKDGVIWVKQGADKRKVTENSEILRLFSESKTYMPDQTAVSGSSLADLDDKKVDHYLNKTYGMGRDGFDVSFANLMSNMGISKPNGELTLAGLLYFGKNPQQYRPAFCIKAVAFYGNDMAGKEYRDSRDLTGTIPELYDQTIHFLDLNLHHVQAGQSFNSLGMLEVSKVALEEICQNALCHREYIRQAPIRVLIFDNRIEIISPGALPDGLTVNEIKMGRTAQRNPLICTLCARTMNYRGLGSGILRAMKEVKDIEFENNEVANEFRVTIKRKVAVSNNGTAVSDKLYDNGRLYDKLYDKHNNKTPFYNRLYDNLYAKLLPTPTYSDNTVMGEDAISYMIIALAFLIDSGNAKTEEIAKSMGLTTPAARVYLRKLTEIGLIKPHGGNKNRTYSISDILNNID